MDDEAYQSYSDEAETWLKRGRLKLIDGLLSRHVGTPDGALQVLEIGAGVGQNVPVLSRYGAVDCVEVSEQGLIELRRHNDVRRIYDAPVPTSLERPYDVIGAFDVLEHLDDDDVAVEWVFDNLNSGGVFIATVPAYQWLFSWHDVALHHHRRYTSRGLALLAEPHGLVLQQGYFVSTLFPVAVATRLGSVISYRRSSDIPVESPTKQSGSMNRFIDQVLSTFLSGEAALVKRGFRFPAGLSTFMVVRKP